MTVDLRGAAYAASRISSTLKGSTKQFGWLQASATKLSLPSVTPEALQPSEFASPTIQIGTDSSRGVVGGQRQTF
jgi:hypothetical protein